MKRLIGLLWKLKVNDDVLEVIKKLLDLGMTPERIAERLDFELESIVCFSKKSWRQV